MILPYYLFGLGYYVLWLLAFRSSGRDIVEPLRSVLFHADGRIPDRAVNILPPMMFSATMIFACLEKYVKSEPLKLVAVLVITFIGNIWTSGFTVRLPMALDCAFSVLIYIYLGYHGRTVIAAVDRLVDGIDSGILRIALFSRSRWSIISASSATSFRICATACGAISRSHT